MRDSKSIAASFGISLLAHILFIVWAVFARISSHMPQPPVRERLIKIRPIASQERMDKKVARKELPDTASLRMDVTALTDSSVTFLDRKKKDVEKKSFGPSVKQNLQPQFSQKHRDVPVDVPDKVLSPNKTSRRETREKIVDLNRPTLDQMPVSRAEKEGGIDIDSDFIDKMPGFTPKFTTGMFDSAKKENASQIAQGYTAGVSRKIKLEDLKEYLAYELSTYQDPADGQKYFKISMRVGEKATILPDIPKEVIFLIDASISIQKDRLDEFKKGVQYSLNNLNPEDTFNIMAFKEETTKFNLTSVPPDAANIRAALRFIDVLKPGEKTDVYNALNKIINEETPKAPASYIFFLSDGFATEGMTDSREVINEIAKTNNGRISIFSFSGGVNFNRYLLDFISYKNRGWAEYSDRTNLISRKLGEMYDKIRDPVLLNMRYNVSGLDEKNIFPKVLPDFFRNAEFTLYGQYNSEEDFILQLLANLQGETKEFTVDGKFKNAVQGEAGIARNWAFNKVYHLIGLLKYGEDNSALINEINYLCNKFQIETPYSGDISK